MSFGVTAAVVGAAGAAYSANKAAKAQKSAAKDANAAQLQMFNQAREDQAPWRDVGGNALNELAMRLGIAGGGYQGSYAGGVGGTPSNSLAGARLVVTDGGIPRPNEELYANNEAYRRAWDSELARHQQNFGTSYTGSSDPGEIENDLRRILKDQMATDIAEQREDVQSNPLYGSLLKTFTAQDFENDPIIQKSFQFGLDEGTKGLNRLAAANGGLDSGAQLKALTRFATDYTGTKGNEAFNRFNINRDSTFNKLASLAGVGQQATQSIGNQGIVTGQGVARNQLLAGDATASGYMGVGNALQRGMSGVYGAGKQNGLWGGNQTPHNYFGWAGMNGFGDSYGTSYGE